MMQLEHMANKCWFYFWKNIAYNGYNSLCATITQFSAIRLSFVGSGSFATISKSAFSKGFTAT